MKELENMSLEELLEFDKNHVVLSSKELSEKKYDNLRAIFYFPSVLALNSTIQNLIATPNLINMITAGANIFMSTISISTLINCIKKKEFPLTTGYNKYRKELPISKELNRLYNVFLEDLIEEINNSPFDKDPLSLAILVSNYLIPLGLLSYTNNFHSTGSIHNTIINSDLEYAVLYPTFLQGIYIQAGYGCCRHYNSFICDLFTKMEIKNDKICCIQCDSEDLEQRKKENNFSSNHVVTGYIENNNYYIIDSYNNSYSFIKKKNFYFDPSSSQFIIPNFSDNLFNQQNSHYSPNIPYNHLTEDEIEEKKKRIGKLLFMEQEIIRFCRFKSNHFKLLEKIAYLTPLEFERTKEKEKLKRI